MRKNQSVFRTILLSTFAVADTTMFVFTATTQAVTIDTVPVGNPGNPVDTRYNATGFGSVGYEYRIGKYEVTNAQYTEFLNGVDPTGANTLALYSSNMSSNAVGGINFNGGAANGSKYQIKPGRDNNPVLVVSWYDSIRFANWLHNGQGAGNTEDGAYTLLGGTPTPSNGLSITRNVGAKWWLPSEDEWYKAAYHRNDGITGNYWNYPTSTDAVPDSDQPPGGDAPDPSNTASVFNNDDIVANGFNDGFAVTGSTSFVDSQNYLTDVGAYTSATSPYGTFDQGGNVWEFNETLVSSSFRGMRGGSWYENCGLCNLHASFRILGFPDEEGIIIGFRVASIIPEPGSIALCLVGVMTLMLRRRTR
jgi:formylglycine-generating enzyme required for sulfatase activity